MENEKKNPPIQTFRLGQVKASIWCNRDFNQGNTYYSVTLTRGYTDQNGDWKDTNSFKMQHIPLVLKVLEHAYDYMHELQRQVFCGNERAEAGSGESAPTAVPDEDPAAYAQA